MTPAAGSAPSGLVPQRSHQLPAAGQVVPATDLDRGLAGIEWLLQRRVITVQQFAVMAARRVALAVDVLPGLESPGSAAGPARQGPPAEGPVAGPEADRLRDRIRALTEEQRSEALLWLSGYTPHGTDLALLAVLTPLGSLGTAP